MRRLFITLALAVLAQGTTAAQDKTAIMATVHHFVDAFNKGDAKTATAACAAQTSIIDEFPPHAWHGPGACAKWLADFEADAKRNGITESVVTLGSPRHVEITTDRAYVVVPADFTYKQRGKVVKETGSVFTVVLQSSGAGWRIVAWAWAAN
jgi:ketosteroid isomerase-like protein